MQAKVNQPYAATLVKGTVCGAVMMEEETGNILAWIIQGILCE